MQTKECFLGAFVSEGLRSLSGAAHYRLLVTGLSRIIHIPVIPSELPVIWSQLTLPWGDVIMSHVSQAVPNKLVFYNRVE